MKKNALISALFLTLLVCKSQTLWQPADSYQTSYTYVFWDGELILKKPQPFPFINNTVYVFETGEQIWVDYGVDSIEHIAEQDTLTFAYYSLSDSATYKKADTLTYGGSLAANAPFYWATDSFFSYFTATEVNCFYKNTWHYFTLAGDEVYITECERIKHFRQQNH